MESRSEGHGGRCVGDHEGVLVANGDQDLMVRSSNSQDLARRLPDTPLDSTRTLGTAESSSTTRLSSLTHSSSWATTSPIG
jgi:hypothetical protein